MKANRIFTVKSFMRGWLPLAGCAVFLLAGCKGNTPAVPAAEPQVVEEQVDTVPPQSGPDRTRYGKGGDFGMSTFSLVLPDGEEYDVTRVSEGGDNGRIYGSTKPGDRYALLLGPDEESIAVLINLDELDRFVKGQYYIYNGELVLTQDGHRDWVDIEHLSSDAFKAKGRSGKSYTFTAPAQ